MREIHLYCLNFDQGHSVYNQQNEVEEKIKKLFAELKASGRSKVTQTLHECIYNESDSLLPTDIPFPMYGIKSSQCCESQIVHRKDLEKNLGMVFML